MTTPSQTPDSRAITAPEATRSFSPLLRTGLILLAYFAAQRLAFHLPKSFGRVAATASHALGAQFSVFYETWWVSDRLGQSGQLLAASVAKPYTASPLHEAVARVLA